MHNHMVTRVTTQYGTKLKPVCIRVFNYNIKLIGKYPRVETSKRDETRDRECP